MNPVFKVFTRACLYEVSQPGQPDWGPFLESPDNFSGPKTCLMLVVFAFKIKVNDTMQLSINQAGLRARNHATFQQVLIQKFAFGPAKLPGLSRNGPWGPFLEAPGNYRAR